MKLLKLSIIIFLLSAVACTKEEATGTCGSIYGVVSNAATGEPVRNANITLKPVGTTAQTGSDGSFHFLELEPGQYALQVQSAGYLSNTKTIKVESGQASRCDIPITQGENGLYVETASLDFGSSDVSRSFIIYNNGQKTLAWHISYDCAWITSLSSSNGTIPAGLNVTVKVNVNRSKLKADSDDTVLSIGSDAGNAAVVVSIKKSGGDEEDPENPSITVANGLYAYYTFEGNTNDITESRLNAIAINNPQYISGSQDGTKAIQLSRADKSYINIPKGLIDGRQFSLSFWVKGLSDGHIFSENTGEHPCFMLFMKDGRLTFCAMYNNFTYNFNDYRFAHGNLTDDGKWHMITLVSGITSYATITTKLYIDGSLVDAITEKYNTLMDDDHGKAIRLSVGGEPIEGNQNLGAISMSVDNLRIYDTRMISDNEVMQIYKAEGGK